MENKIKALGKYQDKGILSTFENQIVDIIEIKDLDKLYGYAKNSSGGIYSKEGTKNLTPVKLIPPALITYTEDEVVDLTGKSFIEGRQSAYSDRDGTKATQIWTDWWNKHKKK